MIKTHLKEIESSFGKVLIVVLLVFLTNNWSVAQNANPFDLNRTRTDEQHNEDVLNRNDFEIDNRLSNATGSSNPFDLYKKPHVASYRKKLEDRPSNFADKSNFKNIDTSNNDFLLWVFLFVLVFIALLLTTNRPLVLKIFKTVWFYNLTNYLYRNFARREMLFYVLMYINFIINFTIFTYLNAHKYFGYGGFDAFIIFFVLVLAIYFLKHAGLYLLSDIFPSLKKVKVYNFTVLIFNISLGFALIPINLMIAYGISFIVEAALVLGAFILILFYVMRLLRGFLITIDYFNYGKFHYFLYLCALEFIPILFLYKLAFNFL